MNNCKVFLKETNSKNDDVRKLLIFAVSTMYVFLLTYVHTDNVTNRQDERGRGGFTP